MHILATATATVCGTHRRHLQRLFEIVPMPGAIITMQHWHLCAKLRGRLLLRNLRIAVTITSYRYTDTFTDWGYRCREHNV